jgi:DNA-binding response OmpR family regulator/class 3 adenylate cyclase/predicted ATPase
MVIPKRVLIVAHQIQLRARIARLLQSAGHTVELAGGRTRALELAATNKIEAAIVVHSDDLTGLGQELRARVPRTIILDHRTNEISRPKLPFRGADVPAQEFDEQKLLDQLRETIPSAGGAGDGARASPVALTIEDCRIDLAGHVFVDGDGREVPLTRAEFALLTLFTGSPGQVLSRDQLRRAIVGRGAGPDDRSIDMLVARLRRKIEPNPKAPRFIVSVAGVGYKFAVRPQAANHSNALSTNEPLNRSGLGDDPSATSPFQGVPARESEPERRHLTVLSCILVEAGALAANLDPEDFGSILRSFQEICTSVVIRWGGAITHAVGDEILASFGYPKCYEDNAERAVCAGLELVEKVSELRSESGEPLQVRTAIATGLVLIEQNRHPLGEAVIVASLLRKIAPPNSVTITANTRNLLGDDVFVCNNPELFEFEGFREPLTAYQVTEKRAIECRFVAHRTGRLTQFVGREHELRQMSTLWERTKGGKGQVALLCGEPGIGKSRLIETWLDRITEEPHTTIMYQCSPHYANSPFFPVITQLKHAAHFAPEDTPDASLRKLEVVLSQTGAATLADTPLYATLLSIPTDRFHSSPDLTPQRRRVLTIAALTEQVLGLALLRPATIVLGDAHWIDSSTLELLSRYIVSIKTARVLILVSFRPEFFPPWLNESHVTMLRLNRLSHEQTGVIISDVAGNKELPCELHEQIIRKTDGVPLFAEELTKMVLASGQLQDAGGLYRAADPASPFAIPLTLSDSLTARLDRLGPTKQIAQIGSVIGREFSYRLLASVASASGPSLQNALEHLAACELIFARGEPPDSTYIFKHALVQDAAYASIVRSKRQQLHRRIADALMTEFHETIEMQPELMAYHLSQAGLTERAIEYLGKAGRHAIERSANAEAIRHLERALEMVGSLPDSPERSRSALGCVVMLGQAMIADRGYAAPETKKILLQAKTLFDDLTDPSQKCAILYMIWASHYVGGEVSKQTDAATEFLVEAERHNDTALLCIAHRLLGTTCVTTGEFGAGLHHLERARALYNPKHHARYRHQYGQDIGVAALCYLSWALWHLGCVDQASAVAAEATKRAEELSHPHTLVYASCHARGFMDLFNRRCDDTRSYAGLVVSLCTENSFSHWINCGRILEAWAEIRHGKVDQGIELLRASIASWRKAGARLWLPIFLTLEAEACMETGRDDAALEFIEEALAVSKDTGERWTMAEVLRVKARLLQIIGRTETREIESVLINSLEIARAQQARCWELRASCDLARVWQGQGREREGLNLLESIYEQFTEGFDTRDLVDARALLENLRRSAGRSQNEYAGRNRTSQNAGDPLGVSASVSVQKGRKHISRRSQNVNGLRTQEQTNGSK